MNEPKTTQLIDQLRQEQSSIHSEIATWKEWWQDLRELGLPKFGDIALQTTTIRNRLKEHFEHEETEDVFDVVRELSSEERDQIERLINEHAMLLSELDLIIQRYESNETDPMKWTEAKSAFDQFLRLLAEHEAREDGLLSKLTRE